jgi:hypothetical protein
LKHAARPHGLTGDITWKTQERDFNMNTRKLCVAFAMLLPITTLAEIYRWTDASGQVHFGDRPPPGSELIGTDTESGIAAGDGLRPGERALLKQIEQSKKSRTTQDGNDATASRKATERAQRDEKACLRLQRRIDDAESELRSGYTASRGETLRKRIKRDREDLRADCR